jgi:hypothetical protein
MCARRSHEQLTNPPSSLGSRTKSNRLPRARLIGFEVKEFTGNIFLGWNGTIHGHEFESFEVLTDNDQGLLVERTVAYRPLLALLTFRDLMYPSSRMCYHRSIGAVQQAQRRRSRFVRECV